MLERGQHYAEQSSDGAAAAEVTASLDAAKTAWRTVREKASTKSAQLREVNRRAEVFHAELGMMLTWLDMSEKKLESITTPSVSRDNMSRQLGDIQSLQNDVERKVRDHEALSIAARSLMEGGDVDQDAVSLKLTEVDNRWRQLGDGEHIVNSFHHLSRSFHSVFSVCPFFSHFVSVLIVTAPLRNHTNTGLLQVIQLK